MIIPRVLTALLAVAGPLWLVDAAVSISVNVTAVTADVESDWTAVFYSHDAPLLLGNDGGPDKGGFHVYNLDSGPALPEVASRVVGRTKLVTTVYGVGGKDLAITIATPDSLIRLFELPSLKPLRGAEFKLLGDWSALCPWRAQSGNQYFFLFGKKQAVQLLVRSRGHETEILEVQTFAVPFEASGCAVSASQAQLYLSADDDKNVYGFDLEETLHNPTVVKIGEAEEDVTGVAVYVPKKSNDDYLFVSSEDAIAVYNNEFDLLGTAKLSGFDDIEVQGLSIYQAATIVYSSGVATFAIESDEATGFGVAPLDDILGQFGIEENAEYNPRHRSCSRKSPISKDCSLSGYSLKGHGRSETCDCFAGFGGRSCQRYTCTDDCSGQGRCIGPNICKCDQGWGGLHCSFLLVEPSFETDANGGDGDDPAIWISPVTRELSRIITTTKSEQGAGLAVFSLNGSLLQTFAAGEPNNVDIIYGFNIGDRSVDLAYAACRADDTLCLFEILSNGTLADIPGGSQPTVDDYTVYGSCTYRSPTSGKQYLFVNEKSARYLQYELTADNGTLHTTLVRDFQGGSGGQVEGCVTDEENGWLILGEEPSALWRYGAEPDSDDEGVAIATVDDGHLYGDVEGVTLVLGSTPNTGFILVSCQGVSAYNIYRRAPPHEYVTTFTITASADGQVDAVTNTDGITAVSTRLGRDFPYGLVVTHDDANQLAEGGTSKQASYKLTSLGSILGAKPLRRLGLLDELNVDWDPRA